MANMQFASNFLCFCAGLHISGPIMDTMYVCSALMLGGGKNQQKSYPNSAVSSMQRVPFYFSGQCMHPSCSGHCSWYVFVEDHSLYQWVYTVLMFWTV